MGKKFDYNNGNIPPWFFALFLAGALLCGIYEIKEWLENLF